MTISIYIKSGTGGYSDYDGCDRLVKEIEDANFPIPRIHESLEILEPNDDKIINPNTGEIAKTYYQYLVIDVHYWVGHNDRYGVNVYVVPIGRSVK